MIRCMLLIVIGSAFNMYAQETQEVNESSATAQELASEQGLTTAEKIIITYRALLAKNTALKNENVELKKEIEGLKKQLQLLIEAGSDQH